MKDNAEYETRLKEISHFNSHNKWKKRGAALIATKFGIGFELHQLNCSSCLIHIYQDGHVLISHAGVEIGQGLHTKMAQVYFPSFFLKKKTFKICFF